MESKRKRDRDVSNLSDIEIKLQTKRKIQIENNKIKSPLQSLSLERTNLVR